MPVGQALAVSGARGRTRQAVGRAGVQARGALAQRARSAAGAESSGRSGARRSRAGCAAAVERGVQGVHEASRARASCALAARPGRAGWLGLCTRCTQPILTRFDSVLFLSQFLDIVREPGS